MGSTCARASEKIGRMLGPIDSPAFVQGGTRCVNTYCANVVMNTHEDARRVSRRAPRLRHGLLLLPHLKCGGAVGRGKRLSHARVRGRLGFGWGRRGDEATVVQRRQHTLLDCACVFVQARVCTSLCPCVSKPACYARPQSRVFCECPPQSKTAHNQIRTRVNELALVGHRRDQGRNRWTASQVRTPRKPFEL